MIVLKVTPFIRKFAWFCFFNYTPGFSTLIESVASLNPLPQFVVHCGDALYPADDDDLWAALFSIISPLCLSIPFYFAPGILYYA